MPEGTDAARTREGKDPPNRVAPAPGRAATATAVALVAEAGPAEQLRELQRLVGTPGLRSIVALAHAGGGGAMVQRAPPDAGVIDPDAGTNAPPAPTDDHAGLDDAGVAGGGGAGGTSAPPSGDGSGAGGNGASPSADVSPAATGTGGGGGQPGTPVVPAEPATPSIPSGAPPTPTGAPPPAPTPAGPPSVPSGPTEVDTDGDGEPDASVDPSVPVLVPPEETRPEQPGPVDAGAAPPTATPSPPPNPPGSPSEGVGPPGSEQRRAYLQGQMWRGLGVGAAQGAGMGAAVTLVTKLAEVGAVRLFARAGVSTTAKAAGPVGAIIGGGLAVWSLCTKDWRKSAETLRGWNRGTGDELVANRLLVVAEMLDILGNILDIVAGLAGLVAVGMWAFAVVTAGAVSPLAATLTTIATVAGVAAMICSGLKTLLQGIATAFQYKAAVASTADDATIRARAAELREGASGVGSFAGGLAASQATGRGFDRSVAPRMGVGVHAPHPSTPLPNEAARVSATPAPPVPAPAGAPGAATAPPAGAPAPGATHPAGAVPAAAPAPNTVPAPDATPVPGAAPSPSGTVPAPGATPAPLDATPLPDAAPAPDATPGGAPHPADATPIPDAVPAPDPAAARQAEAARARAEIDARQARAEARIDGQLRSGLDHVESRRQGAHEWASDKERVQRSSIDSTERRAIDRANAGVDMAQARNQRRYEVTVESINRAEARDAAAARARGDDAGVARVEAEATRAREAAAAEVRQQNIAAEARAEAARVEAEQAAQRRHEQLDAETAATRRRIDEEAAQRGADLRRLADQDRVEARNAADQARQEAEGPQPVVPRTFGFAPWRIVDASSPPPTRLERAAEAVDQGTNAAQGVEAAKNTGQNPWPGRSGLRDYGSAFGGALGDIWASLAGGSSSQRLAPQPASNAEADAGAPPASSAPDGGYVTPPPGPTTGASPPAPDAGAGTPAGTDAGANGATPGPVVPLGPVEQEVRPAYPPEPGSSLQLDFMAVELSHLRGARAEADRNAALAQREEAARSADAPRLDQAVQGTAGAVAATQEHRQVVAATGAANAQAQQHHQRAADQAAGYPSRSGELGTVRALLRAAAGFGSILDLPVLPNGVRNTGRTIIGHATRFQATLAQADAAVSAERAGMPAEQAAIAARGQRIAGAAGEAPATQQDWQRAHEGAQAVAGENQARLANARALGAENRSVGSEAATRESEVEGQRSSLAGQLDAWAEAHRQARLDAVAATRANLEERGYVVTGVRGVD